MMRSDESFVGAGGSSAECILSSGAPMKAPFLIRLDPPDLVTGLSDSFRSRVQECLDSESFARFTQVFEDYARQHVDGRGVLDTLDEVLRGHPHLIAGFNSLMPHSKVVSWSS